MTMRRLCFTIDLDRDVNDAVVGSSAAVSLDRGSGSAPRFSSSERGMDLLLELLDDLGITATVFAEARTLRETGVGTSLSNVEVGMHGYDHEDFSGTRTEVHLSQGEMRDIVERSIQVIRDEVGTSPVGFRSPYMDPNEEMIDFLYEYGIRYDSSRYTYVSDVVEPYALQSYGITEVPVLKGESSGRQITSYLWPMHEGKRPPEDFISLAQTVGEGVCVIATHSWHMVERRSGGLMSQDDVRRNYDDTRRVLSSLVDSGFEPVRCKDTVVRRSPFRALG